jgi:hypothetical protein
LTYAVSVRKLCKSLVTICAHSDRFPASTRRRKVDGPLSHSELTVDGRAED